ncbi:DMT family transporter [Parasedimentitalea maritima]|uniref:EamA family transporter n=1 Tax=Parasedimentitalea maritima TaxID=2578117 RepID=A0A6A4RF89_9RHOB|nr:DMT family transporter [Zongyanglinia marina]KAE9632726.1 EamA family transporter [Zongyanglinia marina]
MNRLRALTVRSEAASAALVLGGALWGVIWLPLRFLAGFGLEGAWPGVLIYSAATLLLLPLAWFVRASLIAHWRQLILCGLLTGGAFSLYSTSLLMTDVVRAVLLFYLTPVWGTVLGLMMLGERLTLGRGLALAMGLIGLLVVLGGGDGLPLPRNLGDVLALLSGFAWAFGTLQLYRMGAVAVSAQVFAFILGSLIVSTVLVALGGAQFGTVPSAAMVGLATPWALLAALYVLPMLFLTIWPATLLSPGRVGLLLMSEVVVGVASAAIWAGEPFGWRQGAGSLLILAAGAVEVLAARR